MTSAITSIKATKRAAHGLAVDQQIAEGLKQARDSSVKKFSIADVEASTESIVARVHAVREQQWHLYGEDTQAWFDALLLSQAQRLQAMGT
jgi:hypothetical protein